MSKLKEMIAASVWGQGLTAEQKRRVEMETIERKVAKGALVSHKGEPVEHWIGVVDGLVKITGVSQSGKETAFTGITSFGWFGEGTLLKNERRRYDVVALRDSQIAYMPRSTFMWLLDSSIEFNRFLLTQLNERLGQFIALVEYDRLLGPDARVARCLASLFNPTLYPGTGSMLAISQEEIGLLAGLSRQRVNHALQLLEQSGLLRIEYGGIIVLDLDGLKRFEN